VELWKSTNRRISHGRRGPTPRKSNKVAFLPGVGPLSEATDVAEARCLSTSPGGGIFSRPKNAARLVHSLSFNGTKGASMQHLLALLAQSSPAPWFAGAGAIVLIIILLLSVFWLWTMIDCLASSMPTGEKVLWFFVILFLHIIGSILYLLIARRSHHRHVAM
jgi:hypothetical protein